MKRTYFPNEYDMEAWVLMSVLDVILSMIWRLESSWVYLTLFIKDSCTCCCYRLSIVVDLWYDVIYTIFYFELADDIYSVLMFVLTPTCMFLSLLFVEYSKRFVVFNSTATLATLQYTGFQGELMLLAWTGSSSSCLDALNFRHGLDFTYFSFLDTLRFSNLR